MYKHCDIESLVCDACEFAKHTRTSYPMSNRRSAAPFVTVHSDVWGPSRITSRAGYKWFVTFIDCYSGVTWVYLMQSKNEVFSCFKEFHKMVSTQFDTKVRVLRSDNGTEYMDGAFQNYLRENGIVHQTTCVNTPAQNGVAERKNRHLLEVARALLLARDVPKFHWGDAVLTAAYLINRMSLPSCDHKAPVELLLGEITFRVLPKVFGSVCFVHEHRRTIEKLDPRALKCIFIGYSATQKG
jgi:transposase InsO family protein